MFANQDFYDICFKIFDPTALAESLSGPNIRLRPKAKIAATVQHCFFHAKQLMLNFKKFSYIYLLIGSFISL